jgi:hypothetical protein
MNVPLNEGMGVGILQRRTMSALLWTRRATFAHMSHTPPTMPPMPAEYYLKHAARVRGLAREATTEAVKLHLSGIALEYEQFAENAQAAARRSSILG